MKKLKDLVVKNITLVTKDETPAVEKAETKFSIFKTVWKAFTKNKISKIQREKLTKISKWYEKTLKKCL